MVWNRTHKIRNPESGKQEHRPRPKKDWVYKEIPELRIIPEDLWQRVQNRFKAINERWGVKRLGGMRRTEKSQGYLFSGLLRCGQCGSNMIIIQGDENGRYAKYGCPGHRYHVDCDNAIAIRRDRLEQQLIDDLTTKRYFIPKPWNMHSNASARKRNTVWTRLLRANQTAAGQRTELHNELAQLKNQAENLADAIAEYRKSGTLLAHLESTETRIHAIEQRLAQQENIERPSVTAGRLREFLLGKAVDLQSVLQGDPLLGREVLAKHIRELVLTPRKTADGPVFDVSGDIDPFWGRSTCSANGGGGRTRTYDLRIMRPSL